MNMNVVFFGELPVGALFTPASNTSLVIEKQASCGIVRRGTKDNPKGSRTYIYPYAPVYPVDAETANV